MQDSVFKKLVKVVHDKSGIHIKEGKKSMVSARIAKRLRALEIEDELAYLKYLQENSEEIVELLNVISTNTTHFYRESTHFEYLRKFVSDWAKEGKTRFRLWCAAASTGEEPYTIAFTLADTFALLGRHPDVKMLATDISTKVLAHCEKGVYLDGQLEKVPEVFKLRYFKKLTGANAGSREVCDEIKKMIVFRRLNLNEPPFPMKGPLDIVFCRNVMIYFDKQTKTRLINAIHQLLCPGGYLFISHTESLTGVTDILDRIGPSIYQKAA